MNAKPNTKQSQWPRKITVGRESVSVYQRETPSGNIGFQVVNYSSGKRKLDSYEIEAEAIEAATKLARQMSQRDVISASMTKEQCIEYASVIQSLQPLNIGLIPAVSTVIEAVKLVGDLPSVIAAVKFFKSRNKEIKARRVSDVVNDLIENKKSSKLSVSYTNDLKNRLAKFSTAFNCDIGNITTPQIQDWMDGLKTKKSTKISSQNYMNFRRVVSLLFEFAVARGYAVDNPLEEVETVKIRNGDVELFTPNEIGKLLKAAEIDFLPCIAIGAFSGLRSKEIERVHWEDIDLKSRHIKISTGVAKTASRRIVPISDNLYEWLAPYANRTGKVWTASSIGFYKKQEATAKAAGIKWKQNALRESFISYRLAIVKDVPKVAYEAGNSAAMIHKHYKELVTEAEGVKWFNVKPEVKQVAAKQKL